mmetsp:Transcript_11595/g.28568  ORF Transcript_11595/g.28568 Transcript_11595/m.28568 type:complete len:264 (-) Transcript_11595:319-1110(-)
MAAILNTLRNEDERVTAVLATVKFTAVYELHNHASQPEWRPLDVGGSLFFVQRNPESSKSVTHKIIVLNRQSLDNFVLDVIGNMILEKQDKYLFVETKGRVYGFWFYHDTDQETCYRMLNGLSKQSTNQLKKGKSVDAHGSNMDGTAADNQNGKRAEKKRFGGKRKGLKSKTSKLNISSAADELMLTPEDLDHKYRSNDTDSERVQMDNLVLIDEDDNVNSTSVASAPLSRENFRGFLLSLIEDPNIFETMYSKYVDYASKAQ